MSNFHKSRVWLNFRFSRISSFTRHIITPSNLRGWRWHLRVRSNQYLVTIILVIEEDMSTSLAPPPRLIISSYDRSKRFNFSSTSKISTDSDNIYVLSHLLLCRLEFSLKLWEAKEIMKVRIHLYSESSLRLCFLSEILDKPGQTAS